MGLGWGWVEGGSWSAPGQTTVIQIKRTIDHMYMINQKGGGCPNYPLDAPSFPRKNCLDLCSMHGLNI